MKKFILPLLFLPLLTFSQSKKVLDHDAYDEWRNVSSRLISNDGKCVAYSLIPNSIGNEELTLLQHDGTPMFSHNRSSELKFTNNSKYLTFNISPELFDLRDLKRKKTKKKDLPMDTLGIYSIDAGQVTKIPRVKSYKVPDKWDDYIVYMYEPEADTSKAAKKMKKRSEDNGFDLVVRSLTDGQEFTLPYVLDYAIAEEGAGLSLVTTGNDTTYRAGVYAFNFESKTFNPIYRSKGKFHQLAWDKKGSQLSFISDTDTTKALLRDFNLHFWEAGNDSSITIANNENFENLNINHQYKNYFSESGKRLFFQTKELPILQDTTLLDEEIVNVEVWSYNDPRLHTQQKIDKKDDVKSGYLSYYDVANDKFVQLGSAEFSDIKVSDEGDGSTAIALNDQPYRQLISWEGFPMNRDLYSINLQTGASKLLEYKIRGSVSLSPKGKYAYWYDYADSAWFAYSFAEEAIKQLTSNDQVPFYNEIHDTPSHPWPYGVMSWTENDERVLIYDRYDIWEINPAGGASRKRITPNGRGKGLTYRYVKLDREERFIKKNQKLILSGFFQDDKHESLFSFTYGKNQPKELVSGDYQFSGILKAKDAKNLIFTQENFKKFPDILSTDLGFTSPKKISDINPQQKEYNWGTSELFYWTSLDGEEMEGMLIKPENFDPKKKYPLMVNFYEKSSNSINRHRDPSPGRSTLNYSFYASRGYVIFNPNVNYKEGYPGESAFNCVIPGVTALINEGFIDKENIGVQGHSWGGYQIAYLITKTDLFKCAEAGAPVPNMISAYGGIRWWTGLSRMFQYEHTQSRIGGTLWEYPMRYIENSPIFYIDKVNTPVLIMHNDADGHVPWYQGIEYFVSLRRLGKPSWMLNYQGEPHWPQKIQNRIDFNIRLAQYFDHYLKGAPMPKWMRDGVPATEVGINQGYELTDD